MQPQHLGDKAGGTGTQGQLWLSSKSEVSLDYLRLSQKQTNNQTKQKQTTTKHTDLGETLLE